MYCPFCNADDTKVVDSRLVADGGQVRRRRECVDCSERFTTYELAELVMPRVIKSDGNREPFDEDKLRAGLQRALEKRPVSIEQIEISLSHIKHFLQVTGEREISSRIIGEEVMRQLQDLDEVAYIRFASVYRSFQDLSEFQDELNRLSDAKPVIGAKMSFSIHDREMMARALVMAAKGRFTTAPNPAVGCVISLDENIVGEGYTKPVGGNHAEIEALKMVSDPTGCSVYVTLEPCSHQGRTPPCVGALIEAGVARVVIACEDPNPEVCGQGIQLLKDAGIEVDCGLLEDQARALNQGFIKRHEHGLPWVLVKMAASIDGRTAMASGQSQWVTTPASRHDVQKLRAKSCAIITGIGTQLMDDPSLTVRITSEQLGVEDELQQPLRVVVDSQLQMQSTARMLTQPGNTLIATLDGESQRERAVALVAAGAEVIFCLHRVSTLIYMHY